MVGTEKKGIKELKRKVNNLELTAGNRKRTRGRYKRCNRTNINFQGKNIKVNNNYSKHKKTTKNFTKRLLKAVL
jgi:hypothetical protein